MGITKELLLTQIDLVRWNAEVAFNEGVDTKEQLDKVKMMLQNLVEIMEENH